MADFYKKYELGKSLEGNQIVHIARNNIGFVIFRAPSEAKLKKEIDNYLHQQALTEEAAAKAKAKRLKEKQESQNVDQSEENATTPAEAKVVRGPDGKFVSTKKSSFWDKLK